MTNLPVPCGLDTLRSEELSCRSFFFPMSVDPGVLTPDYFSSRLLPTYHRPGDFGVRLGPGEDRMYSLPRHIMSSDLSAIREE